MLALSDNDARDGLAKTDHGRARILFRSDAGAEFLARAPQSSTEPQSQDDPVLRTETCRMTDELPPERAAQIRRRIAMALGCTVEDLASGSGSLGDLMETNELLTLWDAIRSDEDRRSVLKAVRDVVQAQTASSPPPD
ncbi:hypothetical protein MPOCJGCO_0273 [Methylobacterium trifolii]|uniref:Uncharacterized protein n=2 Tax=Methylobacterium trifolii TaxID=1003092 RepID=A0ABQ4TTG1_9HYPH|nr:hypothetical protein MPOCJGCO_0273 [Methylobacterium trifolii]